MVQNKDPIVTHTKIPFYFENKTLKDLTFQKHFLKPWTLERKGVKMEG